MAKMRYILTRYTCLLNQNVHKSLCGLCLHSSCQQSLEQKNKFKQFYFHRIKGIFVATWKTIKKLKDSTPFEEPVVLLLKYLPIWADWAEYANCYLLKECCFIIFHSLPCSYNMYHWPYIGRFA